MRAPSARYFCGVFRNCTTSSSSAFVDAGDVVERHALFLRAIVDLDVRATEAERACALAHTPADPGPQRNGRNHRDNPAEQQRLPPGLLLDSSPELDLLRAQHFDDWRDRQTRHARRYQALRSIARVLERGLDLALVDLQCGDVAGL
jgi:hypothetical protein